MTFVTPQWFWLLVPLGLYLLQSQLRARLVWNRKVLFLLMALMSIVMALSRPAFEKAPVESTQQGKDVIIAVDLSYSMRADDLAPSRLGYAKNLLRELVRRDQNDRFGIIGFTTNAIILSPLCDDDTLLLHLFEGLDEELIMTRGTAIMPVLELTRRMSRSPEPLLLVLSDGGDEADYAKEARYAKDAGLHVNVLMLATRSGATIRTNDGSLLKDEQGNIVITRANPAIEQLSRATGGTLLWEPDAAAVSDLLARQEGSDFEQKKQVVEYRELFYLFIILALLFSLFAMTSLGNRVVRLAVGLFLLFGVHLDAGVLDFYYTSQGKTLYAAERYEEAADAFGALDAVSARYNAAVAFYKAGKYEAALNLFQALRSADRAFKSDVFFNMGNCYIRLQEFAKAREMFRRSLLLHASDEAYENLVSISDAQEQDHMITGRQEGKQRAQEGAEENSRSGKRKEGGSSNMDVSATASAQNADGGKETQSDPRLGFSQSKSRLSSKQYELINQRSVHETKPW